MKKLLIGLMISSVILTFGCSKTKEITQSEIENYIASKIETNENKCTLYHYGELEKEEFVSYYQEQINYLNDCLKNKDSEVSADTIDFIVKYINDCNIMLNSGKSRYYEICDDMEQDFKDYQNNNNSFLN